MKIEKCWELLENDLNNMEGNPVDLLLLVNYVKYF